MGYRTNLHIFKGGFVTAARYRDEVLLHYETPRIDSEVVGSDFLLMNKNARPHRAIIVDVYLDSEGISRMVCPACSSLNPI